MRVLKFTGTAGPDMREGQGIIALFAHPVAASSPRLKPLRPLIPHSYSQRVRRFLPATPSHSSLP